MLNLQHIQDILMWQRAQKKAKDNYMTDEADKSCELLIQAIDEGRVQIVPKAP